MSAVAALSGAEFRRRFRWLVFHTWNIPPIFGLGSILLIGVLTPGQLAGILTTPLEPLYILGWLGFAMWYLPRRVRPLSDWLDGRAGADLDRAVQAVRDFPLAYWSTFLVYLLVAPISVVAAAALYTDFVVTPTALFRIELVALIVSIIVGLPIFFLLFDLFGRALGGAALARPIFTIRTKVILIGALVPLLIDTMLVQYYWTRTGFFSWETFAVWLMLELLAIGGSLVFARSFGQGLRPLQSLIGAEPSAAMQPLAGLVGRSTDELGVLTGGYRSLLERLQLHGEILEVNNRLLRRAGADTDTTAAFGAIVELGQQAIGSDQAFVIVHDRDAGELVGVAQTGDGYRAEGHFRLKLDETSLAVWAFNQRRTAVVEETTGDPRVSPRMRERFGVRASMATPLWLEGEAQGVLMVIDRRPRYYGAREIALIEGLAREAALTLHTQRLREARAAAEAEQREQAGQVRLLMNTTEEGIIGVDTEGACTFVNRAAVRMLGYPGPQALLGRNVHQLIHHTYPDGQPYPKEQCRIRLSTLEGQPAHADDEVHWRADGTSFPVEFWSHPVHRDGRLVGAVITFVDISARKQAEAALFRSRAHSEALIAASPVGVFETDAEHACTFVNAALCEIMGLAREQALGTGWMQALHPGDRSTVEAQWREAAQAGHPFALEYRFVRPDGSVAWVLGQAHALRDQAGKIVGHVGTVTDITARHEAQERIERINVELEQRVAQRTADLEAARDLAERANLAKSEFLSRMSHELRTPLNAILGFAQLLRLPGAAASAARSEQHAHQIEKAGWHLLELINDVLDLSRIEAGTMVVERDAIDLPPLYADGVQLVTPIARSAGVRVVDRSAGAASLTVLGDRTRLNQVLMNLLSNAVKYNREGGSVTLDARAVDADWVELSVADTGPGFTPEQLRHLYEPFNRLGAQKGTTEGTGIGLVITRRLVEAMGGTLGLATQEGTGSRFTVRLPRARQGDEAATPASAPASPAVSPPATARSLLYIEDNASNVELLRSALGLRPHLKLLVAPDGPSGLALASAARPDLIVVDITLPGVDGYEVCRRLRADAATAGTPILALSANAMQADIDRGHAAGFDGYFTKPLEIQAFLAQVDRLLA